MVPVRAEALVRPEPGLSAAERPTRGAIAVRLLMLHE